MKEIPNPILIFLPLYLINIKVGVCLSHLMS